MSLEKTLNLTPHDVKVVQTDGKERVFPKSGKELRLLSVSQVKDDNLSQTIDIDVWTPQQFVGIESWHEDSIDYKKLDGIIVSMPVSEFLKTHRHTIQHDIKKNHLIILNPDMGPASAIRENGVPVGTKRLNGWKLGDPVPGKISGL